MHVMLLYYAPSITIYVLNVRIGKMISNAYHFLQRNLFQRNVGSFTFIDYMFLIHLIRTIRFVYFTEDPFVICFTRYHIFLIYEVSISNVCVLNSGFRRILQSISTFVDYMSSVALKSHYVYLLC